MGYRRIHDPGPLPGGPDDTGDNDGAPPDPVLETVAELVAEAGLDALDLDDVAHALGLGRNDVGYDTEEAAYLAALERDALAEMTVITRQLAGVRGPRAKLAAYLDVRIERAESGEDSRIEALLAEGAGLSEEWEEDFEDLRSTSEELLVDVLRDGGELGSVRLGAAGPEVVAALVNGVVDAAAEAVSDGADPDAVAAAARSVLFGGLFADTSAADQAEV